MTQSMEEAINPGDVVVTIKSFKWMSFEKRDILAFHKNGDSTTFVKRVYAVAGDTLQLFRNYIRVGDQKIAHDSVFEIMVEESEHSDSTNIFSASKYLEYLTRNLTQKDRDKSLLGKRNELIVPNDHFFMIGDNYYESMDSRFWGFIPKENIKGKVIWIF